MVADAVVAVLGFVVVVVAVALGFVALGFVAVVSKCSQDWGKLQARLIQMNALFELFELLWVTLNEIELVQKAIQFFYLTVNFQITIVGFYGLPKAYCSSVIFH